MQYYHVDVFSLVALSGNGLTVIFYENDLSEFYMQRLAQEFKQFETIFLKRLNEKCYRARIFTVEEELDFAGHPILGAVSTVHEKIFADEDQVTIEFRLNHKVVNANSRKVDGYYKASMNQGIPQYLGTVEGKLCEDYLKALNLSVTNLYPLWQPEVISTGLPYLVIPLSSGLEQVKILTKDFESKLNEVHAKFVYVFDVDKLEGRTWDNNGNVEDVATGSAAGPVGAYLYKKNIYKSDESIVLSQGRYVGRASCIKIFLETTTGEIFVEGDVVMIAKGELINLM